MRKGMFVVLALGLVLGGCSSSSTPTASGGSGSWCTLANDYKNQSADISKAFSNIDYHDPAKMRQQLAATFKTLRPKFTAMFDHANAVVPAELKSDFTILTNAFNQWMDALAANNYDMIKLAKNPVMQTFSSKRFILASNHVGSYGATHCNIPFTPAPVPSK
ncbi:MAG: hypothetical protein ACYDCC_07295 [Actinomycetota bacterium]